jgi:hypothetical protein
MAAATVHDIKFPEPIQQGPKTREEFDRHVLLLKEYTNEIDKIICEIQPSYTKFKFGNLDYIHSSLNEKQKNLEKIIRKVSQYYEHGSLRFTDAFEVELRLSEAEGILFASQKISDYTKAS